MPGFKSNKKGPVKTAGPMAFTTRLSRDLCQGTHVRRLGPFLTLGNLVLYGLAVIKRPKTFRSNVRVMHKQIRTTIVGNDKTEPFPIVEPFYLTFIQFIVSLGSCDKQACNTDSLVFSRGTLRGKGGYSLTQSQ